MGLLNAQRGYIFMVALKNTARPKKNCKRPPFPSIMERICFGIVSTNLCNVTTFISMQSCINFWLRFCSDERRVEPFL